ncbi:MAG TPA: chitobiase/beta-hexosaminidase C-terminal domain-containing protein, partial [Fibrobacteria bacterium]|nr:chitobiase/beta-hexosaminidase C-terminal domain-containing protein [Fibrobacteria bacterium]
SRGRLYVSYSDDYAAGKVPRKNVSLALVSRRYGASLDTDEERLTLEMRPQTSGTRATWTGSIELADAFPPTDSNNRAETRWRGEAVITAFGHDNTGAQQATTVSASLVIAYPDSQASITYTMADSGQVPSGSEGLIFTVRDQSFSVATNDSVAVSVFCSRSGDSVTAFIARENGTGSYRTGVLQKNEATPNPGDRILSCNSADQIVARYTDPVFGTTAQLVINEVARPVAVPPGRRFGIQEFVTLSTSTPGAVIHYTLDGSIPRPGSSPVYSGPIQVTRTTTLRAVATLEGWKNSKVMTETYTKEASASRLEILDENGNAPVGGYLTGSSTALRIKLTTTQANLPSVDANADVRISGDKENLTLANSSFLGSVLEYWQNVPLRHDSARIAGNDTLETRGTDTLIVVWRNPFDSSDVARDTVIVKPAFVSSEVYFSLTAGGPRITSYPVDQDSVFVVVKTRPRDPSLTYTVSVTSREISSDSEVLPLVELTPGVFSAKVPVGTGSKAAGDGTLQVAASGDQLTAEFQDPVFKDRYRGDAGFAQQVQETAVLQFIHADGRLVAPDEIWDPAAGKVYL